MEVREGPHSYKTLGGGRGTASAGGGGGVGVGAECQEELV